MSCILTIKGKEFDVDFFVSISKLEPYKIFHAGDSKSGGTQNIKKYVFSGISIEVSNADFNDFKTQINDAIIFLRENEEKLKTMTTTKGIEYAALDFGVELKVNQEMNSFTQSHTFPQSLLVLAGRCSLDLELSVYPNYDLR